MLRPARAADAAALAEVRVASWREAYRGLMPAAVLDALDPAVSQARWAATLAVPDHGTVVVVDPHDVPLGYVVAGVSRDTDAAAATGEVVALYLRPGSWGQGLGALLLAEAGRRLHLAGHRRATLWVLAANTRARAFYARHGWAPDGAEKTCPREGATLHEVRHARALP